MRLFKTRKEVQALRSELQDVRAMLVAHFDIKYNLDDFANWQDRNPLAKHIPVKSGEWWHFHDIVQPSGTKGKKTLNKLHYRGRLVKVAEK